MADKDNKFGRAMEADQRMYKYQANKKAIAADEKADPDPGRFTAPQTVQTAPTKVYAEALKTQYSDYSDRNPRSKVQGSFKRGGKVKRTGLYKLHKGERVTRAKHI